jgi:hypothetical protein
MVRIDLYAMKCDVFSKTKGPYLRACIEVAGDTMSSAFLRPRLIMAVTDTCSKSRQGC